MKKIILFLLIFNIFYSIWLYTISSHTTPLNYLYNLSYALNFILAGIGSIVIAKQCYKHHSIHLLLGIGALLNALGQSTWFIYNFFLKTDIPYPGIADIFYIGFYIFVGIGGILAMRSMEVRFDWAKILEIVVVTSVIFAIINSFIQSSTINSDVPVFTKLLDYSYPFFDALLITLTLTAIRSEQGRIQPLLLHFMFSFLMLAFADTLFTYQNTLEIYWNGNFVDAIYAVSGAFFALGVLQLPKVLHSDQSDIKKELEFNQTVAPGTASLV